MALTEPQNNLREDADATPDQNDHAVIAFFGRRRNSRRISLSSKWNPREELWEMLALLLFGALIACVALVHFFGSR